MWILCIMDACLWQVKIDLHQKIKDLTASICNICCSTIQGRYAWFLLIAIAGSHNILYKFHAKCILKFNEKELQKSSTNQCLQHTPYISTCCSQIICCDLSILSPNFGNKVVVVVQVTKNIGDERVRWSIICK